MTSTGKRKGVTLVEAMVTIAILGLVFGLMRFAVDWMVSLGRQRVLLNAQWNAQVTLYDITRNIRNCRQIVAVSSSTLQLAVFRPSETQGFSNPNFVVTATTGTLTYEYVSAEGSTYLLKTYESPSGTRRSKVLVNMLEPPQGTSWIFKPFGVDIPGRYSAVEVIIRLRPSYWNANKFEKPIEYRTVAMQRTSTG